MRGLSPLIWKGGRLFVVDQRLLPLKEKWIELRDVKDVYRAIKDMIIRGAPAIGIVAAFGFYLGIRSIKSEKRGIIEKEAQRVASYLGSARPTAVNLEWALKRMLNLTKSLLSDNSKSLKEIRSLIEAEAVNILNEDVEINRMIGRYGSKLIPKRANILTHCNAGALAVGGYGTALGVIRKAFEDKKDITVFVDETRPYLQGARLTSYELKKLGIRHFVITDNTAGFLMKIGRIDLVITGADRIVSNGDTANKIGTYTLSVLAKENNIPFYIAAPLSTFDINLEKGEEIPIEERSGDEVLSIMGKRIAPKGVKAVHLGFDVTPSKYITAIITERGVFTPPYKKNIKKLFLSK